MKYDLEERLVEFAVLVIDVVDSLPRVAWVTIWRDNWCDRAPLLRSTMERLKAQSQETIFSTK